MTAALASEFVDASARMGATDVSSKHVIANPHLDLCGDRAVSETNAIAVTENAALARLLSLSGFPITGTYPTRGSEAERRIKADNESWLTGG